MPNGHNTKANCHKVYQMVIKAYQNFIFQGLQKYTKTGENILSGNPGGSEQENGGD
jgi:hypothetical protein